MNPTLRSTLGNVELDIDCATRICWGILTGGKGPKKSRGNYAPLFHAFPEISAEDVHQEMLLAICRQWPNYDPSKSQPQTFFHQRARSSMLDMHRRAKSAKEKVNRVMSSCRVEDFEHHDEREPENEQPPEKLLAKNLLIAKRLFSKKRYRRGRRYFTMPQLIAVAMLMRQNPMGTRRCRALLLAQPELCAAIGLKHAPSRWVLMRSAAALRRFELEKTPQRDSEMDRCEIGACRTPAPEESKTENAGIGATYAHVAPIRGEKSRIPSRPRTTQAA